MEKLLSIVVPIYKVEPYINKCLDSLLLYVTNDKGERVLDEQRMGLMDILLINDGTPDNSAVMAREYVKLYPQYFRQIDKENGGHGSVWNMGILEAKGKYIRFLDSDDWLEHLDFLLDKLQKTDTDLVLTNTLDYCPNGEFWLERVHGFIPELEYDIDTYDWKHHKGSLNCFLHHSCTFKREILLPYVPLFLEKQPYDDSVLPMALICVAKTLVEYDFVCYQYLLDRPGQTMSKEVRIKHLAAQIKANQQIILFIENNIKKDESPKALFLMRRVRKMYQNWYKPDFNLSYDDNKHRTALWNEWVRTQNGRPLTPLMLLYYCLPYRLYYGLCKRLMKR